MLTPTQITRLLALPLHWRQRLAGCEGEGRLVSPAWLGVSPLLMEASPGSDDGRWPQGWAWAPCNDLEWLRVAKPEGGSIGLVDTGTTWFIADTGRIIATAKDPIDAALTAMEAQDAK